MSPEITALESQLAAAIAALENFMDEDSMAYTFFDALDIRQAQRVLTDYKIRQPSATEPMPPVPPERADAVALVQQKHQLERAMLASRHERERRETEDWYRRALNEALNSDENGI